MKRFLIACGAVLLACHSPTAPTDSVNKVTGRLSGIVKIGPNCPVEQPGNPCPTPPSAYLLRKILVYDEQRKNLLHTVDIDSQGLYFIELAPAKYLVDLKGAGIDRTSDLPKVIEIHTNTVTTVNVNIDTGLR